MAPQVHGRSATGPPTRGQSWMPGGCVEPWQARRLRKNRIVVSGGVPRLNVAYHDSVRPDLKPSPRAKEVTRTSLLSEPDSLQAGEVRRKNSSFILIPARPMAAAGTVAPNVQQFSTHTNTATRDCDSVGKILWRWPWSELSGHVQNVLAGGLCWPSEP